MSNQSHHSGRTPHNRDPRTPSQRPHTPSHLRTPGRHQHQHHRSVQPRPPPQFVKAPKFVFACLTEPFTCCVCPNLAFDDVAALFEHVSTKHHAHEHGQYSLPASYHCDCSSRSHFATFSGAFEHNKICPGKITQVPLEQLLQHAEETEIRKQPGRHTAQESAEASLKLFMTSLLEPAMRALEKELLAAFDWERVKAWGSSNYHTLFANCAPPNLPAQPPHPQQQHNWLRPDPGAAASASLSDFVPPGPSSSSASHPHSNNATWSVRPGTSNGLENGESVGARPRTPNHFIPPRPVPPPPPAQSSSRPRPPSRDPVWPAPEPSGHGNSKSTGSVLPPPPPPPKLGNMNAPCATEQERPPRPRSLVNYSSNSSSESHDEAEQQRRQRDEARRLMNENQWSPGRSLLRPNSRSADQPHSHTTSNRRSSIPSGRNSSNSSRNSNSANSRDPSAYGERPTTHMDLDMERPASRTSEANSRSQQKTGGMTPDGRDMWPRPSTPNAAGRGMGPRPMTPDSGQDASRRPRASTTMDRSNSSATSRIPHRSRTQTKSPGKRSSDAPISSQKSQSRSGTARVYQQKEKNMADIIGEVAQPKSRSEIRKQQDARSPFNGFTPRTPVLTPNHEPRRPRSPDSPPMSLHQHASALSREATPDYSRNMFDANGRSREATPDHSQNMLGGNFVTPEGCRYAPAAPMTPVDLGRPQVAGTPASECSDKFTPMYMRSPGGIMSPFQAEPRMPKTPGNPGTPGSSFMPGGPAPVFNDPAGRNPESEWEADDSDWRSGLQRVTRSSSSESIGLPRKDATGGRRTTDSRHSRKRSTSPARSRQSGSGRREGSRRSATRSPKGSSRSRKRSPSPKPSSSSHGRKPVKEEPGQGGSGWDYAPQLHRGRTRSEKPQPTPKPSRTSPIKSKSQRPPPSPLRTARERASDTKSSSRQQKESSTRKSTTSDARRTPSGTRVPERTQTPNWLFEPEPIRPRTPGGARAPNGARTPGGPRTPNLSQEPGPFKSRTPGPRTPNLSKEPEPFKSRTPGPRTPGPRTPGPRTPSGARTPVGPLTPLGHRTPGAPESRTQGGGCTPGRELYLGGALTPNRDQLFAPNQLSTQKLKFNLASVAVPGVKKTRVSGTSGGQKSSSTSSNSSAKPKPAYQMPSAAPTVTRTPAAQAPNNALFEKLFILQKKKVEKTDKGNGELGERSGRAAVSEGDANAPEQSQGDNTRAPNPPSASRASTNLAREAPNNSQSGRVPPSRSRTENPRAGKGSGRNRSRSRSPPRKKNR